MGMSVTEFLRRKNEIVKAVTGVILVPEDQIVDIPEDKREPLDDCDVEDISEYIWLDAGFCPYCVLYADSGCNGCPMYEADNLCRRGERSTWGTAFELWIEKSTEKDWKKLKDLVVEYNKQFETTAKDFHEQRRSK